MPRYFFNVENEQPDDVGLELPDSKAARAEAITAAGEILRDIDGAFPDREWVMQVKDARGDSVLELRFSVKDRPS